MGTVALAKHIEPWTRTGYWHGPGFNCWSHPYLVQVLWC